MCTILNAEFEEGPCDFPALQFIGAGLAIVRIRKLPNLSDSLLLIAAESALPARERSARTVGLNRSSLTSVTACEALLRANLSVAEARASIGRYYNARTPHSSLDRQSQNCTQSRLQPNHGRNPRSRSQQNTWAVSCQWNRWTSFLSNWQVMRIRLKIEIKMGASLRMDR